MTARQQELLACVALRGGEAVPRQEIAGRLWPESTDAQALTNLRREWHHLREAWPELDAVLDAGTRTLAWRPDALADLDVNSFERLAALGLQGDPEALVAAAGLYRGHLLPECTADWIEADRERLRQQGVCVLTRLIERLERDRAFGDTLDRAGSQALRSGGYVSLGAKMSSLRVVEGADGGPGEPRRTVRHLLHQPGRRSSEQSSISVEPPPTRSGAAAGAASP